MTDNWRKRWYREQLQRIVHEYMFHKAAKEMLMRQRMVLKIKLSLFLVSMLALIIFAMLVIAFICNISEYK